MGFFPFNLLLKLCLYAFVSQFRYAHISAVPTETEEGTVVGVTGGGEPPQMDAGN